MDTKKLDRWASLLLDTGKRTIWLILRIQRLQQ